MQDIEMSGSVNFKTLIHLVGLSVPRQKLQEFAKIAEHVPAPMQKLMAGIIGITEGTWQVAMHMTQGEQTQISDSTRFQMLTHAVIQEDYDGSYLAFYSRFLNDRKSVIDMLRADGIDLPEGAENAIVAPADIEDSNVERQGCGEPDCPGCNGTLDKLLDNEDSGGISDLLGALLGEVFNSDDVGVKVMRVGPDGIDTVFDSEAQTENKHVNKEGNLNKKGPTENDIKH